jgi:hypothetical protein
LAAAGRFEWEAARPVTKPLATLRRAGLFTASQANAVFVCGTILLAGLLLLQKFGIPFNDSDSVELCLPLTYLALLVLMAMTQKIGIDRNRLILFGLFATLAVGTTILSGRVYSSASLLYAIAIYLPFVFRYYVSPAIYRRLMGLYVNSSLVIVAIVVIQHLVQLSAGPSAWPDLDKLAPEDWLVKGYMYVQPIKYGMTLMKPNAVFLFEASFVSQYVALGLIIELIFFGRIGRMLLLTAGLLLSFAGTGLALIAACAPFLIFRMSPRILLVAVVVAAVTAFAAVELGWYSQVSSRVTEYQVANSSAHLRFVDPATAFVEFLQRPDALYSGVGAGQIPNTYGSVWWPLTKVSIEYGLLTAFAFYAFFIYSLFGYGGHLRLGFALFIFYNFLSGSFAVPVNALTCVFFCTLFRVANPPQAPPRKAARRAAAAPPQQTPAAAPAAVTDLSPAAASADSAS